MAAAIAGTGLPPLSGFIGKLLILQSIAALPGWGWAWAVILGTTLIGIIGFARVGSAIFWKENATTTGTESIALGRRDMIAPVIAIFLLAAWSTGAGWAIMFTEAAAAQILDPAVTARAVLGGP